MNAEERPPRPGRSVLKRVAAGALVIVVACAGITAATILLQLKDAVDIFNQASKGNRIKGVEGVLSDVPAGRPQTILVLGSDQRYVDKVNGNPSRSDTMILVRLDPQRGATAVMSIPRDLKVDIDTKHGVVTDKINAAYALGGPALTVKTVHRLLGIPINHVVNVNFGGFEAAVNRLGCVYVDVDRRYFNDNDPPAGGGPDYATIDVKAGYQKLCGGNALDYVRYRHFDTDLVRAARQQDFLRQAKDQIGLSRLFTDRDQLLRIFGRYTQTDIHSESAILRLIKLAVESAHNPIQEVHFRAALGESYVTATPDQIHRTVDEFLRARASSGARGAPEPRVGDKARTRKTRRHEKAAAPGLFDAAATGEDVAIQAGKGLGFPILYPRLAAVGSSYVGYPDGARGYTIKDRSGHRHKAYRLVVEAPGVGQYYGVQGMTWTDPPILEDPSESKRIDGRTYDLYYDGDRLRLVALHRGRAVYWVSNTLLETLTNDQMLGIASSLRRVGS